MDDLLRSELVDVAETLFSNANRLRVRAVGGRVLDVEAASQLNNILADAERELRAVGRRLRSIVGESPESSPTSGTVADSEWNSLKVAIRADVLLSWKNQLEDCLWARIPMTEAPTNEHYLNAAARCLASVAAFVDNELRPTIPPELLERDERPF